MNPVWAYPLPWVRHRLKTFLAFQKRINRNSKVEEHRPVFKSERKIDALASSQKISLMVGFEGLRWWFSEEENQTRKTELHIDEQQRLDELRMRDLTFIYTQNPTASEMQGSHWRHIVELWRYQSMGVKAEPFLCGRYRKRQASAEVTTCWKRDLGLVSHQRTGIFL